MKFVHESVFVRAGSFVFHKNEAKIFKCKATRRQNLLIEFLRELTTPNMKVAQFKYKHNAGGYFFDT